MRFYPHLTLDMNKQKNKRSSDMDPVGSAFGLHRHNIRENFTSFFRKKT